MTWWTRRNRRPEATAPTRADPRPEIITQALRTVPQHCDVMTADLKHAVANTENAAVSLIGRMSGVYQLADDLLGLAKAVKDVHDELAEANSSHGKLLVRLIRSSARRDQQIRELVAEVRTLSRHVAVVEELSRTTNILAINAMIEGTRAGKAGRGFAVVADEVHRLAERSGHAASGIGTNIQELTSRLQSVLDDETLHDEDGPDIADDLGSLGQTAAARCLVDIANSQRDLAAKAAGALQRTIEATQQVGDTSVALASDTTAAVGDLQYQDISRQIIEHVTGTIDEMRGRVESVAAYADGQLSSDQVLAQIQTAAEPRCFHATDRKLQTVGDSQQSPQSEPPAIELF